MDETKPMKILFYIESLRSGGKERRIVELIKGLSKFPEIEMELVLTKGDIHYTEIFDTGIKIHYTIRKAIDINPGLFWRFYKIAKKTKPDIIHVWGHLLAVYAYPYKILHKVPILNNSISYAMQVISYSKLDIISRVSFFCSDFVFSNSYAGLRAHKLNLTEKYAVIHNGFDFDRIVREKPVNIREMIGIPNTSIVVAMIGSLEPSKDYFTFIDAAHEIHKSNSIIHFAIVGGGRMMSALQEYTNGSSYIHFLGRRNDLDRFYKSIDLGVILSNTVGHAEGISNAIMEFMANSIPVIATNAGGTPELVQDGISGFLVPPFDANIVVEKLNYFIENCNKASEMGQAGRQILETNFTIKKMTDSYLQIYFSLCKEKK